MLSVLQINLHHARTASAALLLRLAVSGEDVVLIQEPWINKNRICGLRMKGYDILYSSNSGKTRSCILGKSSLNLFLLSQYSNGDITAASLEVGNNKVWLAAAYMDQEKDIPPNNLGELVLEADQRKIGLVLGGDVNAHHTIWGSTDINKRGQLLFNYLLQTNLHICNIGQEPTFITKNRREVLNVTFISSIILYIIGEW